MPPELNDRAADNCRPLLAIAEFTSPAWAERARKAAMMLHRDADQVDDSPGVMLLVDLHSIFQSVKRDKLSSDEIVKSLGDMEHRPWPEWRHGRPITTRQLAQILKPFRVGPKTVRLGANTPKGYERDQFVDAFARYCGAATAQQP